MSRPSARLQAVFQAVLSSRLTAVSSFGAAGPCTASPEISRGGRLAERPGPRKAKSGLACRRWLRDILGAESGLRDGLERRQRWNRWQAVCMGL